MNKLWYLKQLNLFKTLPDEEVELISNRLVMKNYGKRQVIHPALPEWLQNAFFAIE